MIFCFHVGPDVLVVFMDNNASILCYMREIRSFEGSVPEHHSAVLPPVLKIQTSTLSYISYICNKPSSRQQNMDGPLGVHHFLGGGVQAKAAVFIELLPGRERPDEVVHVARSILQLAPLLQRHRLAAPYENGTSSEWHGIFLKALERAEKEEDEEGGTVWTSHLRRTVLELAGHMRSSVSSATLESVAEDLAVEEGVKAAQEQVCPALSLLVSSLSLSAGTQPRGREDAQSRVKLHGNSIQIELSSAAEETTGYSEGGDMHLSPSCLIHLIQSAAVHPAVVSVSVGPVHNIANYDAVAMSQSGTTDKQPFRLAGLTGQHQICGVADTGLDGKLLLCVALALSTLFYCRCLAAISSCPDTSCFFRDYFPTEADLSHITSGINDSDPLEKGGAAYRSPTTKRSYLVEHHRRKVVQYVPYADTTDARGDVNVT